MPRHERVSGEALTTLTRVLSEAWLEINRGHFRGKLRPATIEILLLGRQLGRWEPQRRRIVISESLLIEQPWGVVLEVLKHEMVHQYVHEVLERTDEPPHGPSFLAECARLGIDSRARGLPRDPSPDARRDKILGRVQRLLALAESDNIHEAQSAMKAAQKLMLRFNIDAIEGGTSSEASFLQIGEIRQRHSAHVQILSGILGAHFFVRCIWVHAWNISTMKPGRVLEICGTKPNLHIAAYVHDFLLVTGERLWSEHKSTQKIRSNTERRRFLSGVMMGFSESLETAARVHEETGLVWVGDPQVEAYLHQRHPRIRRGSSSQVQTTPAWAAGRCAGRKIVLHKPMKGRSRGGPRRLLG